MKHLFCGGMLALAATLTQGAFAQSLESHHLNPQVSGSTQPTGAGMKMTSQTMMNGALSPMIPVGTLTTDDQGKQGDARLGAMSVMGAGAEIDFQHWNIKNGPKGYTYWAIPNFVWTFGKDTELTLCVPMSSTDYNNIRGDMNTVGTDLRLKQRFGDFYIGGHVNAMYANTRSYLMDDTRNHDDFYTVGMGPFAGVDINITEGMTLSLGGLVDYGYAQNHVNSVVAGLGASLGIQVVSGLAVSPYVTYYNFLQREGDQLSDDRDFFEVGIDLLGAIKDNWTFSVGIKDTLDYEDFKCWDLYIGTIFRF
jgi:hypothetical protein